MGNLVDCVAFLKAIPIVQVVNGLTIVVSGIPLIIFASRLHLIALHLNCKFLLYAWSIAFLLGILTHIALVVVDLASGIYVPFTNMDPTYRLYIISFHGFTHALSSTHELLLSMSLILACAFPEKYHDNYISTKSLLFGEICSISWSSYLFSQMIANNYAFGFLLNTILDIVSLCVCRKLFFVDMITSFQFLAITNLYTTRKMSHLQGSSLKIKYQMKETFEIGRVMMHCGAASLVMKFLALFMCWTLVFGFFDPLIAFTVAESGYLIFETLNCAICCCILLVFHAGLRRKTKILLGMKDHSIRPLYSIATESDMYFDDLRRAWN